MNRTTLIVCVGLLAGVAGASFAQETHDPIAERKQRMDVIGDASRTGGQMIRGDTEFDPQTAAEVLTTMNEAITGFADLFPAGTETDDETEAAPAIFERPDEFRERAEAMEVATAGAAEAAPQTLEEFRTLFGEVSQNCRACHEDFRVRRN
ncbi:c-type cytochrome [Aureimonas mangrovi]|uniref:c-type cytochrome n=1 Tax=Aureimonas mangrovi TaxID=2758041 RepID=UPI00163D466E|nr:cytochrome c [Aureimonas mangrovi]